MKLNTEFITSLIKCDNPIPLIWKRLFNIWFNNAEGTLNEYYYRGEEDAFLFEEFLLKAYDEFFANILPRACLNESSPFQKEASDVCFIVMDGMSIREGVLIFKTLQRHGIVSKMNYSLSAIPSDTQSFRVKVKSDLSGKDKFVEINNPGKIRISQDVHFIWSYFPDVMLDKIQVGHTVISDLENMYKTVEKVILEVLERINSKKIIILSDHGYIRSEPGFSFAVPDTTKKKLKEAFGSSRYITMEKYDLADLVQVGLVVDFAGYYLVKSRYTWPMPGKYNIYLHGGISLMECFVPVIEVER
jgi:hypothetical protein